jgi:hypothetical protein
MKTLLLPKDLLIPQDARQTAVTQSQKESWLRLMERERTNQFASVASGDRASGKSSNSQAYFQAGAEQFNEGIEANSFRSGLSEMGGLPATSVLRSGMLPANSEGYARYLNSGEAALLPPGMHITPDGGAEVSAPLGIEAGAGLPLLERMLRQRWPRANVLIAKEFDGLRIWIRDPDLLKNPKGLDELVAQIKEELAGEGLSLNSLTVNGETVFCNKEG